MSRARKRKRSKPESVEEPDSIRLDDATAPRVSKHELAVVIILMFLGVAFRGVLPSRMAIEHFDEGVYASNICSGPEFNYSYPARHLYAPPLLPSLIEWSTVVERAVTPSSTVPSSLTIMAPSLLAGCLTIVAVWWIAREWLGVTIGMAALALAAISDLHALYSRTALTESLLLLFLVLSLWAGRRALARPGLGIVTLTGLFIGLAWWTKYNGWLPLPILLAAICLTVLRRSPEKRLGQSVACWVGMAFVGFAIWSPYLWQLEQAGGYAEVAANHKKYVVGVSGWWSSLEQQYANLIHYDGWASCAGVAIATVLTARAGEASATSVWRRQRFKCGTLALTLAALAVWLGSFFVMFGLGLAFVATKLRQLRSHEEEELNTAPWAWELCTVWIAALFVTTPLYHPYPRLTLPWICGLWFAGAAGVGEIMKLRYFSDTAAAKRDWLAIGFAIIAFAMLSLAAITSNISFEPPAWQSRARWQPIVEQISAEIENQARQATNDPSYAIVYVYSEPALFFHLEHHGAQAIVPAGDTFFAGTFDLTIPTFLVAGPELQISQPDAEKTMDLVATYEYEPSDLVALNHQHPRELRSSAAAAREVRVYRMRAQP